LRLAEATYFGRAFSRDATGSAGSVTLGQYEAKMSYVRRPRRKASTCPIRRRWCGSATIARRECVAA
jgi:hypothetical protein